MRKSLSVLLGSVIVLVPLALTGAPSPSDPDPKKVQESVDRLGSPDFSIREQAHQFLLEWGIRQPEGVLKLLPRETPDLEVRTRIEKLRREITLEAARRKAVELAGQDRRKADAIDAFFKNPSEDTFMEIRMAL